MIKVVQLQYSIRSAGSAALRLHKAFKELGIDSSIISLLPDIINDDGIKYLTKKSRIIATLDGQTKKYVNKKVLSEYGSFSYPVLGTDVSSIEEVKNADFIYMHWVLGGFLNLSNMKEIFKLKKPVIIFMHDMWWITGGCHHSFSCEKYMTACHNCQMLKGNKQRDLSSNEFYHKLRLYSAFDNLYFISPSKWLLECAQKATLTKKKQLFYIPNTIENSVFKPFDKLVAKQIFNIESNEIVIGFGAIKLESPYKGWPFLLSALKILQQDKDLPYISILIFGSGYDKKIANSLSLKTHFLGFLRDEYSISAAYNAMNVFVTPSLADNQPTTIVESMCCGTPVVGFDVGGIPDMILHKQNGYVAKYKDAEDLATGIKFCIQNQLKGYLLPPFYKDTTVKKHLELFNQINPSLRIY